MSNKKLRLAVLIVPLLILFVPKFDLFIFPNQSEYSDLLISHYPNAIHLIRSVLETGQIPLWSDTILSGYPFFANPLAGIWYPPGWIAYLLPAPFGFNLSIFLHLLWGGIGMFLFLRKEGVSFSGSIFGAIAFECMPKAFAHAAAGHITLIYGLAWLPWLLLAEKIRIDGNNNLAVKKRTWYLPGVVLGLMILADVRWAAYGSLIFGLFAIRNIRLNQTISIRAFQTVFLLILQGIMAIFIASPILIPLVQFTTLSTRILLGSQDFFNYSLPFDKLLGIIIPDYLGYAEWITYPGAIILLLLVYSLAVRDVRSKTWLWIGLFFAGIIFSLGEYLPFLNFLSKIPGIQLLRVPSRMLFLSGFSLCVISAYAFQHLVNVKDVQVPDPVFFMVPIAVFIILMGVGLLYLGSTTPPNFWWASGVFSISILIIILLERKLLDRNFLVPILFLILIADLCGVNLQSVTYHSKKEVNQEAGKVIDWIQTRQNGIYRVYAPDYAIPQHTAALYHLQLANGVDPLQYQPYIEYLQRATKTTSNAYSVVQPPLTKENETIKPPDLALLGNLNVMYIVTDQPYDLIGIQKVYQLEGRTIYENPYAKPRVWMQQDRTSIEDQYEKVEIISYQSGRIHIRAAGKGTVVFSEIAYPGWKATVNGSLSNVLRIDNIFLAVETKDLGINEIVLEFDPWINSIGILVGLFAWIVIFVSWGVSKK